MGKKSRSKVQRQKQTAAVAKSQPRAARSNTSLVAKLAANQSSQGMTAPIAQHRSTSVSENFDYSYVASDIKRTLLLISISAVVLIAAVIVNDRSSALLNLGEKLTNLFGLGV